MSDLVGPLLTSLQTSSLDYVRLAIKYGQLIETDTVLDDDSDSPTFGKFVETYQSTTGAA